MDQNKANSKTHLLPIPPSYFAPDERDWAIFIHV